ncbi:unnamed protein product [Bursaphelenchus xylophilus]|uniref:(pine wood nematode) hypothetical protein n=1 Tax=Bursaphelenchus xylophilus TaxID=6326 RepID=A0A1I7RXS0_BURXY|nr:unnamed protein product [Bursaphelenchus xylophilus]CAG9126687.1 unnamed protein product [Bursaphelenchus xylophilus]
MTEVIKVLGSYNGRDKAMRSLCFGLFLISNRVKNQEFAKNLKLLAAQISKARLVSRQFSHIPLFYGTMNLWKVFRQSPDQVETGLSLFTMIGYCLYAVFEFGCWLNDVNLIAISRENWYKYAIFSWVSALVASIIQNLRKILFIEPLEDKHGLVDKQKQEQRTMDRILLVGTVSDFIAGVGLLPQNFLWGGKLTEQQSSFFFFVASVIGLYRCF